MFGPEKQYWTTLLPELIKKVIIIRKALWDVNSESFDG